MRISAVMGAPSTVVTGLATNAVIDSRAGDSSNKNDVSVTFDDIVNYGNGEDVQFLVNDDLETGADVKNNKIASHKTLKNEIESDKIESNSEQYRTMWTLEEDVLSKSEVAQFYGKLSEKENNKLRNYVVSQDGDTIFEVGNKLIYTDSRYSRPTIYKVITFGSENESVNALVREEIYDAEKSGNGLQNAKSIIEITYGEGYISETTFDNSRAYARQNGRRKGTYSGAVDSRSGKNVDAFDEILNVSEKKNNGDRQFSIYDGASDIQDVLTPEEESRIEGFSGDAKNLIEKLGFAVTDVPHVQNMPDIVDGYVNFGRREVYINPNAKNRKGVIFKHEITHILERSKGSRYVESLKNYIQENMSAQWDLTYEKNRAKYESIKAKDPAFQVTKSLIESETLADFAMHFSTDNAISYYANNKPDFAKSVRDFFKYLSLQIKRLTGNFTSQNEAELITLKWERALSKAVRQGERNNASSGVMFNLAGKRLDGIDVYEVSDEIKAMPYKERRKMFLGLMKNEYRGKTARFIKNGEKYYATFDESDVQKNIYGDKKSDDNGRDAKLNVGADGDIFDLVEHSKYVRSEEEKGKNNESHNGVTDWDYFEKTVQIDNAVYDVYINVRNKASDSFVYSIHLRENKSIKAALPHRSASKASVKSGNDRLYGISLSQNDDSVNGSNMHNSQNDAGNTVTQGTNTGDGSLCPKK